MAKSSQRKTKADLERENEELRAQIDAKVDERVLPTVEPDMVQPREALTATRKWAEGRGWTFIHEQPFSFVPEADGTLRAQQGAFRAEKSHGPRVYRQSASSMDGLLSAIASYEDEIARRNPSSPTIVEGAAASLDVRA